MDLIVLVLVLCAVGFVTWFLTSRIPMDPMVRTLIQVVVVIAIFLYLLRRFAVLPNLL